MSDANQIPLKDDKSSGEDHLMKIEESKPLPKRPESKAETKLLKKSYISKLRYWA